MMDIGRVCIKKAGRDSGKQCVIVDVIDEHFVLIDGETRRRKCNIAHLSPTEKVIALEKGASHDIVTSTLQVSTAPKKSKTPAAKPVKKRKVKAAVK